MSGVPKIVVLTPVKNEAWILDRFLSVSSRFADAILIANQQSTDVSRDIAARYERVLWIDNPSSAYDEASRQRLLLAEARHRWPAPTILLALDADEILAADALASDDWRKMLAAPPGTILLFEKPDLLPGIERCIRYPANPVPLGFVDDGAAEHHARHIHSPRLPQPTGAPRLLIEGVKFLHYGLTRTATQLAKVRYYAVLENLAGTNPLHRRRRYYGQFQRDLATQIASKAEPMPRVWFDSWEASGIDMRSVREGAMPWQEIEVLRAFARHGTRRFWLDAIWDVDWEQRRLAALREGINDIPTTPIAPPLWLHRTLGLAIDTARWLIASLRRPRAAQP